MTETAQHNKPLSFGEGKRGGARPGYYSECTRDEAFGLIIDHREPIKRRVYYWLLIHGPATRWEVKDGMGLELSSVCARINELMHDGVCKEIAGEEGKKFNTKTKKNNRLVKAVEKQGELF